MIKSVKFKKMNLEMKKPFKIALGSTDFYEGFLVSIETDDGITGYGEA
ncbi:MAG: O-succinylbenzoate-CoA synthase, partial [Thermoplasmatales archaeon Gpl]